MKFDTIVLAGNKGLTDNSFRENKACLKIKGVPVISYILDTLDQVEEVDRVYLVGPQKDFCPSLKIGSKKLTNIFEQRENLIENIWNVFLSTLPPDNNSTLSQEYPYRERAILFVPGDIPLVTPQEIKFFLSRCDLNQYDYFVGITSEDNLSHFHPTRELSGLKLVCFQFQEKKYRINNLHLVKPLLLAKQKEYIQKVYTYRHQKKFRNILRLSWELFREKRGLPLLKYYLFVQSSRFLNRIYLPHLAVIFQDLCPVFRIEESISDFLQIRFKSIHVPFGGAALDIDNEKDYQVISRMFETWQRYLEKAKIEDTPE